VVVTVSEGWAGGVAELGLTKHCGVPVVCTGVTVQGITLNATGLLKPPLAVRSMVAIEEPPGSTADGWSPPGALRLKPACPKARDTDAAENTDSSKAKTMGRTTCLGFTMSGWELTTFDSSNGAKAARAGPKECRLLISRKSNGIRQASCRMRLRES